MPGDISDLESGPIQAAETALNFECELVGVRAARDGVRVTFNVHPQEACLPMFLEVGINKRFYCSAVAVGDNEDIAPPPSIVDGIRAVRQAAMLCRNEEFHQFGIGQCYMEQRPSAAEQEDAAILFVRTWCRVRSRSDLRYDKEARGRLNELIGEFLAWQRTKFQTATNEEARDNLDL